MADTGSLRSKVRRLLVVEDDSDTSNLLKIYFDSHNYEVTVVPDGAAAVAEAQRRAPDLVLLDIILPDEQFDGLAVFKALRASPRTSYVPIIFLTGKKSQADQFAGLSLGAQDYVTKPFDLEELRLRMQNILLRTEREYLTDPRTGLPTGRLAEEQLRGVSKRPDWQVLTCRIEAFQPFVDLNGFAAGDDVIKFAAQLLREVVEQHGTPQDFLTHPANETFRVATAAAAEPLKAQLTARFNAEVLVHYSFMDREQGYILIRGADGQTGQAPLMTLKVEAQPA